MPSRPDIHTEQGFGRAVGFGRSPALLVVDFQRGLTAADGPLGGGNIGAAVEHTAGLMRRAADEHLPILIMKTEYRQDGADAGVFAMKARTPEILVNGSPHAALDARLPTTVESVVLVKKMPSAFFGTPLVMHLVTAQVDTLIIAGCVTSGCIRATVVDGMSLGYRVIVPEECVGDRDLDAHEASLLDIDRKYADVLPVSEVETWLTTHPVSR